MNPQYLRYIGASAAALGVDFATFILGLSIGVPAAAAAAVGYCAGIACHWLISSRLVFIGQVAQAGSARRAQQSLFVVTALVGLAITTAIVGVASHQGLDPRLAKAVAIAASFQATYLLRKRIVFA